MTGKLINIQYNGILVQRDNTMYSYEQSFKLEPEYYNYIMKKQQ